MFVQGGLLPLMSQLISLFWAKCAEFQVQSLVPLRVGNDRCGRGTP